jgi:hypothetical protein
MGNTLATTTRTEKEKVTNAERQETKRMLAIYNGAFYEGKGFSGYLAS